MHLTGFILDMYATRLCELGLYRPIQATQYEINNNFAQFFSLLEMYAPSSGTFFTSNGELGIGLYEMWIILGL